DSNGDGVTDQTIGGSLSLLPSGFSKGIITSATPANANFPTDGTAYFYLLEAPGVALIIKPQGSINGEVIALAARGSCSGVLTNYNWIQAGFSGNGYDVTTTDAYGTATLSGTLAAVNVAGTKFNIT